MDIREAHKDDLTPLSKLATKTYEDAFGSSFSAEDLQKRIDETRSEKYFEHALSKDVILIAEVEGEMAGYVEFGPPDLPIEGILEGDEELSRLYVLASHQRKGIGKALMDAALAHSRLRNAENIYLDVWEKNEGARRLYKSYGFEETGTVVDGDIIMVRRKLIA